LIVSATAESLLAGEPEIRIAPVAAADPAHHPRFRRSTTPGSEEGMYELPVYQSRIHAINEIWINITNDGMIGAYRDPNDPIGTMVADPREDRMALKISWLPSMEFPPRSQNDYLFFVYPLIGCVRGFDTLVSDELVTRTKITETSSQRSRPGYSPTAVADQQFETVYSDTMTAMLRYWDHVDFRPHIPIGVEVRQASFGWTSTFAKRFIIFNYWIRNIGDQPMEKWCFGLYVWPIIANDARWSDPNLGTDPVVGFLSEVPGARRWHNR